MQIRSKNCILQCPFSYILKKVYPVFVEWKHLRVSLLMVRTRSCTSSVQKINENSHLSAKQTECEDNNILGQHVITQRAMEEMLQALDSLIFLLQNLSFVINKEKSQFQPVPKIEFLRLVVNSVSVTLPLPKNKTEKLLAQCKELKNNPQTAVIELTQLLGKVSFSAQMVLMGRLHQRFLTPIPNFNFERVILSEQDYIWQQASGEIKWWRENLILNNGKPHHISQGISQMLLQTDASTQVREVCYQGISTGANGWSKRESSLTISTF